MGRPRIRLGVFAAALLLAPACRAQARADADAFTADMAARLSRATGREFVVSAPLTVKLKDARPDAHTLYLDRIFQFCAHNSAEDCEISKANFAASTAEVFTELPPLTADRLRVVVRASDYCAQMPARDQKGRPGPLQRPFAEGLCTVLMVDYPHTRRTVSPGDLDELRLKPETAWQVATVQTLKAAPKIGDFPADGGPLILQGGDYVPGALLDIAGWRALAARAKGELFMAVPEDDLVVVYAGLKAEDIPALRQIVREDEVAAERGISASVYRWNGSGWTVVR